MNKYIVTEAEFVISAPDLAGCLNPIGPEIAFAGRSNVGKSSLLNFLAAKKQLARVSSTPGRTRLLNFFRFVLRAEPEKVLGVVDLPGYGFAQVSHEARRAFGPMMEGFLFGRKSLKALALLIDIRREPEEEEKQIVTIAQENGMRLIPLLTKSDELPKSKRLPRQAEIAKLLGTTQRPIITSTKENLGFDDTWRAILSTLFPLTTEQKQPSPPSPERHRDLRRPTGALATNQTSRSSATLAKPPHCPPES
jgi:GTP-binding protein